MYDQLAQIALQLIAGSNVRADDNALNAAVAVRRMLTRIATKELIVGEPLLDPPKETPG